MVMPMPRFSNGRLLSLLVSFEKTKPYTLIDIQPKSWFSLEDKNIYLVCKSYHGLYSC